MIFRSKTGREKVTFQELFFDFQGLPEVPYLSEVLYILSRIDILHFSTFSLPNSLLEPKSSEKGPKREPGGVQKGLQKEVRFWVPNG